MAEAHHGVVQESDAWDVAGAHFYAFGGMAGIIDAFAELPNANVIWDGEVGSEFRVLPYGLHA